MLFLEDSGVLRNNWNCPPSYRFSLYSRHYAKVCNDWGAWKSNPAAWPSDSERRFYDGHDRKVDGSSPTQASLLRPWIRCFTTIISAWWNLISSKLKKIEVKFKRKTRKQKQLLSESGFVLCIVLRRFLGTRG